MKCIVCPASTHAGLSPWHHVCPACRYEAAQLEPTINEKQAHDLVNEGDREVALKRLREDNFKTIVTRLKALAPPGARTLLDVGSAHGWFLEQAAERFEVLGVEPDAAVGEMAARRGLPVRIGYFPDALPEGAKFDVIVFNDVIEHIPAVHDALQACHARLNPNGLLVLNVPCSRGFFYRLSKLFARLNLNGPFDRMWQKDLPSPHVHYFNEANLNALVERHGLHKLEAFELASLRLSGLMERLRFVGKVNPLVLYAQYAAIALAIPVLKLFPSDILVCIYRKGDAPAG